MRGALGHDLFDLCVNPSLVAKLCGVNKTQRICESSQKPKTSNCNT